MGINWSTINWQQLVLTHFSCAMFVVAIGIFILDWIMQKIRRQKNNDLLLRWLLLLPVGFTGIYAFFMHLFFPASSAAVMNWPTSPFQFEVALANLCIGLLGILSFRAGYGFRLATVIVASFWMWGHAISEIYQIVITSNIYLGNAVSWFWIDVILPFVLISCIKKSRPVAIATIDEYPQPE